MDILNQIKKIVLLEVSDDAKHTKLHSFLKDFSKDWTIKFSKKDNILDYKIKLKQKIIQGKLNLT